MRPLTPSLFGQDPSQAKDWGEWHVSAGLPCLLSRRQRDMVPDVTALNWLAFVWILMRERGAGRGHRSVRAKCRAASIIRPRGVTHRTKMLDTTKS